MFQLCFFDFATSWWREIYITKLHRFLLAKLQAWREVMAAYRRVYDSRHLMADYQEPGSAPEPYARQSSIGLPLPFTLKLQLA